MNHRVVDFYRRRSEGFGDSRSGSNDRIVLTDDPLADVDDPVEDVAFEPSTRETAERVGSRVSEKPHDHERRGGSAWGWPWRAHGAREQLAER